MTERILLIYSEQWALHPKDRAYWIARYENEIEAEDYDTKEHLIEKAKAERVRYRVLRHHKNGTVSIMQESK